MPTGRYKPTLSGDVVSFNSLYTSQKADGTKRDFSQTVRIKKTPETVDLHLPAAAAVAGGAAAPAAVSLQSLLLRVNEGSNEIFKVSTDSRGQRFVTISNSVLSGLTPEQLAAFGTPDFIDANSVSFQISSISMVDSKKDGLDKGFQISLAGGVNIQSNARGLQLSDAAGNVLVQTSPAGDATYSPLMTKQFLDLAFNPDPTVSLKAITRTATRVTETDILDGAKSLNAFSPEFILSLAAMTEIDPATNTGTLNFGDFQILRANVQGLSNDASPTTVNNDLILIKHPTGNYVFDANGAPPFKSFQDVTMVHEKRKKEDGHLDAGIVFVRNSGKTTQNIELPVTLPFTAGSVNIDNASMPYQQVQKIGEFLDLRASRTSKSDLKVGDRFYSSSADTIKTDLIRTDGITPKAAKIVADPVLPDPPGGGGGGGGGGPVDPPPVVPDPPAPPSPTRRKRQLPGILKALGAAGLIVGVALLIMSAVVPAIGVAALIAGGVIGMTGLAAITAGNAIPEDTVVNQASAAIDAALAAHNDREAAASNFFSRERDISQVKNALRSMTLSTKERAKLQKQLDKLQHQNDEVIAASNPAIIATLKGQHLARFTEKYKAEHDGNPPSQEELDLAAFEFMDKNRYQIVQNLRRNAGSKSARNAIANMSLAERCLIEEADQDMSDHIDMVRAVGVPANPAVVGKDAAAILNNTRKVNLTDNLHPGAAVVAKNNSWVRDFAFQYSALELEKETIDHTIDDVENLRDYAKSIHERVLGGISADAEASLNAATDLARTFDADPRHATEEAKRETLTTTSTALSDAAARVEKQTKKDKRDAVLGR